MRKTPRTQRDNEMLDEYDFSQGERGKYAKSYTEGTNLIVLAPDLLEFFPDSDAVNKALREYISMSGQGKKAAS